jgi:hypothetical protein
MRKIDTRKRISVDQHNWPKNSTLFLPVFWLSTVSDYEGWLFLRDIILVASPKNQYQDSVDFLCELKWLQLVLILKAN